MITAMCCGNRVQSSSGGQGERDAVSVLVAGGRLKTAFQTLSSPRYVVPVAGIRSD